MTTAVALDGEYELRELYGRCKTLALSAAAALILESGVDDLATEAERLHGDCVAAHRTASRLGPQLAACVEASRELSALLAGAAGGAWTDAGLEQARASYRRLRRSVWSVLPCEYVPCCASAHPHTHGEEC